MLDNIAPFPHHTPICACHGYTQTPANTYSQEPPYHAQQAKRHIFTSSLRGYFWSKDSNRHFTHRRQRSSSQNTFFPSRPWPRSPGQRIVGAGRHTCCPVNSARRFAQHEHTSDKCSNGHGPDGPDAITERTGRVWHRKWRDDG